MSVKLIAFVVNEEGKHLDEEEISSIPNVGDTINRKHKVLNVDHEFRRGHQIVTITVRSAE